MGLYTFELKRQGSFQMDVLLYLHCTILHAWASGARAMYHHSRRVPQGLRRDLSGTVNLANPSQTVKHVGMHSSEQAENISLCLMSH